jgi:hypothetical protein
MSREPKGSVTGFRFAESMMQLIVGFAEHLGITRTKLVEDSVTLSANVISLAASSVIAMIGELTRRYGEDAPLTIRVVPGADGNGEAVVLIDGQPPDDITKAISIDEKNGVAYVFIDVNDWFPERLGTVQIGDAVMITRPLMAITKLPWPPDETLGMVVRLGELVENPEAQKLVEFPASAVL